MNQKKKTNRGLLAALALVLLLGSWLREDAAIMARAELGSSFSIVAEMLPSGKETYDVRLTLENQGEDWEGTVRVMVDEGYRKSCAYDTVLSLPQGTRKQLVVKIPVNSIDNTNGTVIVTLLNKRNETAARREFQRLLSEQMDSLSMGILSDVYPELTYLDMGGAEIYFYDDFYPIGLVELQQGSLVDALNGLTFLVIDQYNTGILTEEELEAIELWMTDGGVLIIGTGAYVEDTTRGFDGSFLEISYGEVHAPGDGYAFNNYAKNAFVDFDQLTVVELDDIGYSNGYIGHYAGGWAKSAGDGSVCVLPYSLAELGKADNFTVDDGQEAFVLKLMETVCDCASSRYSSPLSYYDDLSSYIRRMLGVVGNGNSILNFGALKVIVVMYVIFVGPLLYLILRLVKRRELYWVAVPVTALLGICLIFFAGRGFEVVSTKVYSVTVRNLSGSGKSVTYLHCYDADRREWDLQLAEGCEYVGPLGNLSYYGNLNDHSYYYHIKKEGDVYYLGINPSSNFEDSYFYLSSTGNDSGAEGSLLMQDMAVDWTGVSGTVVNDTNKDMDYFAVICNDSLYVYEELPTGAACYLNDVEPLYTMSGHSYGSYIYSLVGNFYDDGEYRKASALSALGVGICDVVSQSKNSEFIVIGLVENWDKTVDDNCSEISYGCLYSVQ